MEEKKGLRAIIAVNNNNVIGIGDTLPWRCSADLKHFKAMTLNQRLLVGHNTFHGMPPLKDRTVIVDKRGEYITDVDWCIGGKKTYEKYAHLFTELHVSHINDNSEGDTFYPDLTNLAEGCQVHHYYFEPNEKKPA